MVFVVAAALMVGADHWSETTVVTAVALSPDGKVLAAGNSAGRVYLADVATGKVTANLPIGYQYPVSTVSFSPSGRYLCASTALFIFVPKDNIAGDLVVHDLSMGKQVFRFSSPGAITKAAFFPAEDGVALFTDGDEVITLNLIGKVQDKATIRRDILAWDGVQSVDHVSSLGVVGDPPTVYLTKKTDVTLWEPKSGRRPVQLSIDAQLLAVDARLNRVAYVDEGNLTTVGLRPQPKEKPVRSRLKLNSHILPFPWFVNPAAAFSKDGRLLYLAMKSERDEYPTAIVAWDVVADREVDRFERPESVTAFAPVGDLVAVASRNSKIHIWNLKTGKKQLIDLDP